jgi:hypothetical protein
MTPLHRKFTVVLLASLYASHSAAFDVEGFTTGMSKETVMAKAGRTYKVRELEGETVVAEQPSGAYLSFNFCDGRLAAIQQGFPASLKQMTMLVSEFKRKYGNPFSTNAGPSASPHGVSYQWGIWFHAGQEFASIYYSGTDLAEGLSTSHQAVNKCFKVPR